MTKLLTMTRLTIGATVLALFASAAARDADACGDYMDEETREIVETAIGGSLADAKDAIEILRARGWEGVYALSSYEHREKDEARKAHIRAMLDKVAGQKDAFASRLFWHTDLDEAKAAAAKRKLPILSLRLLGRLDEDLSCANSRYFRTVLYADERVHHYLRQHYVLHWKTVRPVPVVTVDFGDGRKVCRTVTGNSAHLVLDQDGRPLDVLPGLYSAKAFRAGLEQAHAVARGLEGIHPSERAHVLARVHRNAGSRLDEAFAKDLKALGDRNAEGMLKRVLARRAAFEKRDTTEKPSARRAARDAVSKSIGETAMVEAIQPEVLLVSADMDVHRYRRIAGLPRHADELGAGSLALMRAKTPKMSEEAFGRMLATFTQSVLHDSVRNEHLKHRTVHRWFENENVPTDADALTERIYDELFYMPSDDAWLGLVPANAYSALDDGGFVREATPRRVSQANASR